MLTDNQAYEFVEVWQTKNPDERGCMVRRGLIPDICDHNNGRPISETGPPPAHYNCKCDTAVTIREKESAG